MILKIRELLSLVRLGSHELSTTINLERCMGKNWPDLGHVPGKLKITVTGTKEEQFTRGKSYYQKSRSLVLSGKIKKQKAKCLKTVYKYSEWHCTGSLGTAHRTLQQTWNGFEVLVLSFWTYAEKQCFKGLTIQSNLYWKLCHKYSVFILHLLGHCSILWSVCIAHVEKADLTLMISSRPVSPDCPGVSPHPFSPAWIVPRLPPLPLLALPTAKVLIKPHILIDSGLFPLSFRPRTLQWKEPWRSSFTF